MVLSNLRVFLTVKCLTIAVVFSGCRGVKSNKSYGKNIESKNISISPEFYPISGPTDAIYQNRTITRNYYFGGDALNQVLFGKQGTQRFNANWLHYGIWGSLRAGESIDGTDLQSVLTVKDLTFRSFEASLSWLPESMVKSLKDDLSQDEKALNALIRIVQHSVADGNRRVADEILGLTDRFVRSLGCDNQFDENHLKKFLDTFDYQFPRDAQLEVLWSGILAAVPELSAGKRHAGGQDALARAYDAYYHAKFEANSQRQTEMMHYGNLLIAIHEQFVLQTYISGALSIMDPASSIYKKIATFLAMDVGVPAKGFTGVSRPGEGLSRTPLRRGFYATGFIPSLKVYSWEPLRELARVTHLDQFSGQGSRDWTDYKSRIYLIAGMMQTYHDSPLLASFPYSGPHKTVTVSCSGGAEPL